MRPPLQPWIKPIIVAVPTFLIFFFGMLDASLQNSSGGIGLWNLPASLFDVVSLVTLLAIIALPILMIRAYQQSPKETWPTLRTTIIGVLAFLAIVILAFTENLWWALFGVAEIIWIVYPWMKKSKQV